MFKMSDDSIRLVVFFKRDFKFIGIILDGSEEI